MYTNAQQLNPHQDQLRNELPTHESATGADFKPTHGGVGSLPGGRDETGVAMLPDERAQQKNMHTMNTQQAGTGPTGTVPGTQQPLSSATGNAQSKAYSAPTHLQNPPRQEGTNGNVNIPGTPGYDPQVQSNEQHRPGRVEQAEGDVGHGDKPSLGQRMKQGIKDMKEGLTGNK